MKIQETIYKMKKLMLIVLKKITKYRKVILKKHQRFKSERHNVFTEEINKIALSS